MTANFVEKSYALAKERYAELGVDADAAMNRLQDVAISMHCWQGDDVGGFESAGGLSGGGIMATGNYPGRARNADELRADAAKALSLIPGKHRFSLHAIYLEHGGKQGRAERGSPGAFPALDGLGGRVGHRPGLQPHVLLASEGGRRLHAGPSRRGHPPLLGRARHRLPQDRRGLRAAARARPASPTSGFPTA